MIWVRASEQEGRAAPFDIAEVWPVLRITDQRGQVRVEVPRDLGRIDEPLQLEGLEPAQAIADDDPAPRSVADVGARAMECAAEPDQRVARRSEEHTSELQSLMRITY